MSEVPLGVYLSGGIDSASVVGAMSQLGHKEIKTFSVGFPQDDYNELKNAKTTAEHFNTDHQEIIIEEDMAKHIPQITWQQDEPMSDPTSIPVFLLSKEAKKLPIISAASCTSFERSTGT